MSTREWMNQFAVSRYNPASSDAIFESTVVGDPSPNARRIVASRLGVPAESLSYGSETLNQGVRGLVATGATLATAGALPAVLPVVKANAAPLANIAAKMVTRALGFDIAQKTARIAVGDEPVDNFLEAMTPIIAFTSTHPAEIQAGVQGLKALAGTVNNAVLGSSRLNSVADNMVRQRTKEQIEQANNRVLNNWEMYRNLSPGLKKVIEERAKRVNIVVEKNSPDIHYGGYSIPPHPFRYGGDDYNIMMNEKFPLKDRVAASLRWNEPVVGIVRDSNPVKTILNVGKFSRNLPQTASHEQVHQIQNVADFGAQNTYRDRIIKPNVPYLISYGRDGGETNFGYANQEIPAYTGGIRNAMREFNINRPSDLKEMVKYFEQRLSDTNIMQALTNDFVNKATNEFNNSGVDRTKFSPRDFVIKALFKEFN